MAVFVILAVCSFILIYVWFQFKFTYWSRKGVFGPKPIFPYGNIKDVITRKSQFFQPYCDIYFKYKHLPYVGMYCFHRPVLCVNDLELAKHILVRDFEHFQSRGTYSGGEGDRLAGNLFNIHGTVWKKLRLKMSPSFTSGKLKIIYPIMVKIANDALTYADMLHRNGESVNFSELYGRYAMEIIANIGFGVECNGFNYAKSEFYDRGREYFDPRTLYWTIIRGFAFIAPDTFEKLKLKRISSRIENFFYSLVKHTVEHRKKYSYKRNDFLQTLIELMEEQDKKGVTNRIEFPFTMDDLAANTMLYMIAGYETSATTGQFAAYQLARNPHIQNKAREEILGVLHKYGGQFSYEAQNEMVYMNMVLEETMRMYPSMRAIFRRCTKDYQMPGSDLVVEEGTLVFVPCQAFQMDPEIFPEPEQFDPERFTPENKAKLHPCHWMPFGEGPRKCLGVRQGYIQSKLALVKILQEYELQLDQRTLVPMRIKTTSLVPQAEGDVWIKLRRLDEIKTEA
uniref:unspecific monooxygenase n=1 Tax=Chilo suppressalis TaxID=168631 RepID=X5DAZ2_CHISP|nr:CYP6CT1 [Chilo suppressalis]